MLWCTCQTLTYVIRATDAHAKSRHTAPVRAHSPGTTAPKSVGSGREQHATGCVAGRPRRSDVVVRGQARPEGVRCRSRAAGQRAADGKKFGFWAPWRREAASCCPSRNLGAATRSVDFYLSDSQSIQFDTVLIQFDTVANLSNFRIRLTRFMSRSSALW